MSTSLPGDTPASRSQRQAKGKAKKIRGISGLTSSTPFAQYDPDSHSWKTCEGTSLWDSETFSPTLPAAGILRNGRLFQRPRLAPRTVATASSSWPTPTTMDHLPPRSAKHWNANRQTTASTPSNTQGRSRIPEQMADPTGRRLEEREPESETTEDPRLGSSEGRELAYPDGDRWRRFGPLADDRKEVFGGEDYPRGENGISAGLRGIGKLNPEWVGWLMGFPPGWTNLEDSETPSSLTSPNSSEG
jgi:hypothetical protein